MDFKTGIVGIKRGISYQSIGEAIYIEPRAGVKGGSAHRSTIRRALEQMEKSGIVRKKPSENLVFLLPFAQAGKYDHKKADTNPTPHTDTPKASQNKALQVEADMGKNEKADIPLRSDIKPLLITTTTTSLYGANELKNAGSSSHLIFSERLDEATRKSMLNILKDVDFESQQILIDEVQGFIDRGKLKSTVVSLLKSLVTKFKANDFTANYANKTASERNRRKAENEKVTDKKQKQQKQIPSAERLAAFKAQREKLKG